MNSVSQVRSDRPRCRVAPSALALLSSARQGLAGAEDEASAGGRYVAAHLAALRAAAAVVAATAEAGLPCAVSLREADDLLRDAETFLSLAESALGVPGQTLLPLRTAG